MELFKQEMELFVLFSEFRWKNFFYKMLLTFNNDIKTSFENRKLNYPNRKLNYFFWLQIQKLLLQNVATLRPNLESNFPWILQVLTYKLGHAVALFCWCRPPTHPPHTHRITQNPTLTKPTSLKFCIQPRPAKIRQSQSFWTDWFGFGLVFLRNGIVAKRSPNQSKFNT